MVAYLAMPGASPEQAEAIAAVSGGRLATGAPREVDDGTWTESDLGQCRLAAAEVAKAASERMRIAVSSNRVGVGGPSTEMVERSAHLLCSATHKPRHLCKSYWRKQFMGAIRVYAADFKEVSTQAYWTAYDVSERAKRARKGEADWKAVTDDLRQTTLDMARMNEEIVSAFRALIADGIINPDDFGVFFGLGIPPEIAKMIGGTRPVRKLCG